MRTETNSIRWEAFWAVLSVIAAIINFLYQNWCGLAITLVLSMLIFLGMQAIVWVNNRWDRKAIKLFKGLIQDDFLVWQQQAIDRMYPELEIVSLYGKHYPAAIIRPDKVHQYPFEDLLRLTSHDMPNYVFDRKQEQYLKILRKFLRAPKMKGYALSKVHLDANGKSKSFEAITSNQEQNLTTCHILEWELFEYFRKHGDLSKVVGGIIEELPYRSRYHDGRSSLDAICEPHHAFPLISVQAIVIYKDTTMSNDPVWKVVLAERSDEVIVKPGFYQFQPAGGFEVYGKEDDNEDFLLRINFDIGLATLREYAEEIFDAEELQENPEGRDPRYIVSHPMIQTLLACVKEGNAHFEYLGLIFDLTILRPEFSFLILIEDDFFCKSGLLGSWESRNLVGVEIHRLGSDLAGAHLSKPRLVHCSSAGILQLAIENPRLKRIGISSALSKH